MNHLKMGWLDGAEFLLLSALWGSSFLFMRVAAPVLGPIWLMEVRVLLAGVVLLPLLIRLDLIKALRQSWKSLLIVGVLNCALPFVLFALAAIALPVGFTAILNATTPLFGMVIAAVWLKEKLTAVRLVGLALGFAGVVVLVGWQGLALSTQVGVAIGAGLCASLMYAIAALYIKQAMAGVPSLVVTTGSQLGAAVVLLPALPFTIPQEWPSPLVVGAVVALSLFSTSLAYILYFRLIQHIGSTRALTVSYLVPLFAIFWGAIALGEVITVSMGLGCGLVLLGTAIANGLVEGLMGKLMGGRFGSLK